MKNHYVDYEQALTCSPDQFGARMGDIFMGWRKEENISAASLVDICARYFGEPKDPVIRKVAAAALQMADERTVNAYHDHHHNREVAALTLAMLIRHKMNMIEPEISADMAWLTLSGAAIHDYKHDGTGNRVNGVTSPMRLERLALQSSAPALREAGISWKDWHTICMVVLPTDITPTADRPSPCMQLKQVYNACNGKRADVCRVDPMFVSVLCDPVLATCAQIVSDADLGISAGLDYRLAMQNCENLCIETKGAIPWRPAAFKYYLTEICKDFPGSDAGKTLLAPGFNRIKCLNERDQHLGISFGIR